MDIVTHGITGVLVSRALSSGYRGSMMMAGLIGALAPDLDAVARLWDPMAAITVHRTVTHSLIGGGIFLVKAKKVSLAKLDLAGMTLCMLVTGVHHLAKVRRRS